MRKTLVGPQLRQLRRSFNHTQAEMARQLGVSAAYINLLENNQRSLSVKMLMELTESYGIDWRALVNDSEITHLADLRTAVRDPIFEGDTPDLQEMRAALDHAPKLVDLFLQLYRNHAKLRENMRNVAAAGGVTEMMMTSPETAIYDFFRNHSNYFSDLELAADSARSAVGGRQDDLYSTLKRHLKNAFRIDVEIMSVDKMPEALRIFAEDQRRVELSEALDQINRNFQLAHVLALVSCAGLLDQLSASAQIPTEMGQARCRVELANYFAAAFLMPYDEVLRVAQTTDYDIDRIATTFGVSFEQACQRLTTLQRKGAQGVPFFFLRTDTSGNVTKRFNATAFTLAEQGGACPVWNIHSAFISPGRIVAQLVELPDAGQFFTISRTSDRPVVSRHTPDRRRVVTLGCERAHVGQIGYAAPLNIEDRTNIAKIGINCHICPRQACSERAHEPLHINLPVDANRRGSTRYES
ncbi:MULTISPECIES: helix-turn-helix domain-containing protein [Roseobacter]|uniref:Helix-turn-helix protein n=1 Tax=Roseobacter litoralis (strain ATCC 49566 / DSM 6996 / JCM 21268 / NBRC 15278 / OCh 149) TaxID=391595 RepID=F7ZE17_ROSLO|nr:MULTISPECIES: helix-turn-helix transcriptional regulator [Roseobacter]AEI93338.1 putative helix-turn-helix protein [Roseobacter litoralis Och 149]